MRANEFIIESTSINLGPQLYVPRPKKTNEMFGLKPNAKVWTSTAVKYKDGYASEWVDWCYGEMPHWIGEEGTLFDIRPGARILVINTDKQAIAIAKKYGVDVKDQMDLYRKMPWDKLSKDYDAIHHNPEEMDRYNNTFMRSWDVESTAWYNTDYLINPKKVPISKEPVSEDLKKSLATAGLAASLALGMPGQTGNTDLPTRNVSAPMQAPQQQIKPDPQAVKQMASGLATPAAEVLRKAAKTAGIRGPELAQLLAQAAHETQNFTRLRETGGKLDFKKYDMKYNPDKAKILGNTKHGDGFKYFGRGYLHITGKYNYKKVGDALGLDLIKHPELLEKPETAAKAAVYYWQHRVVPKVNDWNDTAVVTKPINSGLDQLNTRQKYFRAVMSLMKLPLSEYNVDNKNGLGAVPDNDKIDYFGLRVKMKPSIFLKLALPLDKDASVDYIKNHIEKGGSLGSPFLDISVPGEYEDGDYTKPATVAGHEGRNRMKAILQTEGDDPVEVHLFFKHGLRARDITPDMKSSLRSGLINQKKTQLITGPIFA
jgi:putative chitinase